MPAWRLRKVHVYQGKGAHIERPFDSKRSGTHGGLVRWAVADFARKVAFKRGGLRKGRGKLQKAYGGAGRWGVEACHIGEGGGVTLAELQLDEPPC